MEAIILLAVVFGLGFWLGRLTGRRSRGEVPMTAPEVAAMKPGATPNTFRSFRRDTLGYEADPWRHRRPEFRIAYADEDGEITEREIYVHSHGRRSGQMYYFCWCFLREEERTFRGDRIMKAVNLDTGREIKDLAAYRDR